MKKEVVDYLKFLDNKVLEKIPLIEKEIYHELVSLSYGLLNSNHVLGDIKRINFLVNVLVQKRIFSYNLYIEFGEMINSIIRSLKKL